MNETFWRLAQQAHYQSRQPKRAINPTLEAEVAYCLSIGITVELYLSNGRRTVTLKRAGRDKAWERTVVVSPSEELAPSVADARRQLQDQITIGV